MGDTEADVFSSEDSIKKLKEAIDSGDIESIVKAVLEIPSGELAFSVSRLSEAEQQRLFEGLTAEEAAGLLEHLNEIQTISIVEEMNPQRAAAVVEELPSEERADILKELDSEDSEAILSHMQTSDALDARRLMNFEEGTAGSVMYSEMLIYKMDVTASEILENLRANYATYSDFEVQYAYIVGKRKKLVGVLPVRNLLFAPGDKTAKEMMIPNPVTVSADATLAELEDIFDKHNFLGLPVVDASGALLGVTDKASVSEGMEERSAEDLLKVTGLMGREEIRSMPLQQRSTRRLSWLSINIVLNMISASVIAMHEDTLQAVIALAVFLPIISDMSGCSGNQAVGVSLRELSLGLLKPTEFLRVFYKESTLGLINGVCLGLILGTLATIWKSNLYLGLVVGSALMLNTIIAVCVGGLVPLLLKWRNQDPALASGPILTTVTDMCGFLLVLTLASMCIDKLV
ncbi:MAG: magnesium transporter [Opitutaceae bacterium]